MIRRTFHLEPHGWPQVVLETEVIEAHPVRLAVTLSGPKELQCCLRVCISWNGTDWIALREEAVFRGFASFASFSCGPGRLRVSLWPQTALPVEGEIACEQLPEVRGEARDAS